MPPQTDLSPHEGRQLSDRVRIRGTGTRADSDSRSGSGSGRRVPRTCARAGAAPRLGPQPLQAGTGLCVSTRRGGTGARTRVESHAQRATGRGTSSARRGSVEGKHHGRDVVAIVVEFGGGGRRRGPPGAAHRLLAAEAQWRAGWLLL